MKHANDNTITRVWRRFSTCVPTGWKPVPHTTACIALISMAAGDRCPGQSPDSQLELLRANQTVFRSIADRLAPYLVRIETVGGSQPPQVLVQANEEDENALPRPRPQNPFRDTPGSHFVVADGPTTGIVYSSDGYIVTSSFNFVREPQLISVTLPGGRRMAADLIARDQVRKIALLKVNAKNLATPKWAADDDVRVGQWAIALGLGFAAHRSNTGPERSNAGPERSEGPDIPAVSVGIVSALRRMAGNACQTDAKISPANYGGPLVDIRGRVIGICVPMAQRPGELAGVEMYDSGVGFAIPKSRLDDIVNKLKTGENVYRGWLGVNIDVSVQDAVVIEQLADPSPLRSAGVLPGDKIIKAAGKDIRHFGHLVKALYMIPAGQRVRLTLQRDEKMFSVEVPLKRGIELGPLPEAPEPLDPSLPLP